MKKYVEMLVLTVSILGVGTSAYAHPGSGWITTNETTKQQHPGVGWTAPDHNGAGW